MQISPEVAQNTQIKVAEQAPKVQSEVATNSISSKSSLAIEDRLTLDGEQKAKDEKSTYSAGKNSKLASSEEGEGGDPYDKLIKMLKKQLEKLLAMLKTVTDLETQQTINSQIADVQGKLIDVLEKKAQAMEKKHNFGGV